MWALLARKVSLFPSEKCRSTFLKIGCHLVNTGKEGGFYSTGQLKTMYQTRIFSDVFDHEA
jgi:hypothetical protein